MKRFLCIVAAAMALLTACQVKEAFNFKQGNETTAEGGIHFDVYTQRGLAADTKAGIPGTNDNANIGERGFGVFAYYTAGEKYDVNAKPLFMYNQKVEKKSGEWVYEPVKYWPNEYGNAAVSDEMDYVSFFAYAPWTDFVPTTGEAIAANTHDQKYNIISVNKNNAVGDPVIKYVVDTDPKTSVDLLWGVAAANAAGNYSAIDTAYNKESIVKPGFPFLNLTKPGNPKEDKLSFNLKHALAKVKFTIDYVKDDFTPEGADAAAPQTINADETRIFVRSFTIGGWATRGALNLNNSDGKAGQPLWKDFDGAKDLAFDDITFHDGRKDGKEGDVNGIQSNEENQGLNPNIIENFSAPVTNADGKLVFNGIWNEDDKKTSGVTAKPQLLFGGDPAANGGYFYVIPRNEPGANVNVTIVYDVETIDPQLADLLSDGATHGRTIENVISKQSILGPGKDFEAGKQYLVKIHIGMTSVKIEAAVTDWVPTEDTYVDLPDNQPVGAVAEAPDDLHTPLTFEAITPGTRLMFKPASHLTGHIQISTDGGETWTDDDFCILDKVGDKVSFRGDNPTYCTPDWPGGLTISLFFLASGSCYVYGNIMSLISPEDFATATSVDKYALAYLFSGNQDLYNHPVRDVVLPATTLSEACYALMFFGCSGLTRAPELPAQTLAEGCYTAMFAGSGIETAPALPAQTLASYCYSIMFGACPNLKTAPELPAQELADSCYFQMFSNDTSLITPPVLPAPTLVKGCYNNMFSNCSKLSSITCLATDISAEECTSDWLTNVSESGTFKAANASVPWTAGNNGIPTGWIRENKD